jgi:hypothetical protein
MLRQVQDTLCGWDSFASLACDLLHCQRRKWLHQDENLGNRNPELVCIVRLCYWLTQKLCTLSTVTSYYWFYLLLCLYNKARMISFLVRELLFWAGAGSVHCVQLSSAISPLISSNEIFHWGQCTLSSIQPYTVYAWNMLNIAKALILNHKIPFKKLKWEIKKCKTYSEKCPYLGQELLPN